jgi:hypothetical protein
MSTSGRGLFVILGSVALAGAPAVAGTAFSPQAVFAMPDHRAIDDRCTDARKFADQASMQTDTIAPGDAVAAGKAFLECTAEPSVDPDPDKTRYLALSAAAAFYLAGTNATGGSAERLFRAADHIAAQLGGATPDASIGVAKIEGNATGGMNRNESDPDQQGQNAANGIAAPGPPHTTTVTKRDALNGSIGLSYGGLVDQLRVAVATQLASLGTQPSASVLPQAPAARAIAPSPPAR